MTRTTRFLGGLSLGYVNTVLVILAGLWLTPFFLQRIGQHDYGLWLVGSQIMAYLMLMDFGVVALLPRETAYATGRAGGSHEATDLPKIIGQTPRLVLWQLPFIAVAALILWFSMPAAWEALRKPLGVIMLAFVFMFPLRVFQAVLQGLQDLAFLGGAQIFAWVLTTTITVGLVFEGVGLYALAIGWVAGQVSSTTLCWYRLRCRFPRVLPRHLPVLPWDMARDQLGRGFWVSVAQVAQVLLNGTDLLIIGKLLGPVAVVPYVCTGKLISVLANQPQMVMQVAFPALSEMKTAEPPKRVFQVCTALNQATLMLSGVIICVVLMVNQAFVGWWVGVDLYSGFGLTVLLSLSMLLRHWNSTMIYPMLCFGYERRISLTNLLDGLVTIPGSLLLVWQFGPIGAPMGSILGVCLVSLPGNLSALSREVEQSAATFVMSLWPWFWRFLILALGAGAIAGMELPRSFLSLAVTGVAAAVVYLSVMLPIALRPPLGAYLRTRLDPIWMRLFGAHRSGHLT